MKKIILALTFLSIEVQAYDCSLRIQTHLNMETSAKRIYKIIRKQIEAKGYTTQSTNYPKYTLTVISDRDFDPERGQVLIVDGYLDNNKTKDRVDIYGDSTARFYERAKKLALANAIASLPDCDDLNI